MICDGIGQVSGTGERFCFGVRDTGWVLRDEQGVIGHVGAVARAMDMEVGGGDLGQGASRASVGNKMRRRPYNDRCNLPREVQILVSAQTKACEGSKPAPRGT